MASPATGTRNGVFDHAVLNLHYEVDASEKLFSALGFQVTSRGYHSLGSMNNLIMFGTNYLELIGLDPDNPNQRKELLEWPVGLNGLVYGSDDVDATKRRLESQQIPTLEPKSFSRPVDIDGTSKEARFRTLNVERDYFPASRLYFCEHRTPELVWQEALLHHPNSAHNLQRIMLVDDDPGLQATKLAQAADATAGPGFAVDGGNTTVDCRVKQQYADDFGDNIALDGPLPRIVGLSFSVHSFAKLKQSMTAEWKQKLVASAQGSLLVPASLCFGVMLEFIETD